MPKGAIVIYESTVYPGATEEVCVPMLEKHSGLAFNRGFFAGYSPERINPGDKQHRLPTIKKVTSGSTPESATSSMPCIAHHYRRHPQGLLHQGGRSCQGDRKHPARSQHRAHERTGVDLHRLGIDTLEVLEAAGTKWNFLPFRPGLVGGHCIGVDPYYLIQKAQKSDTTPRSFWPAAASTTPWASMWRGRWSS
jgi:UDP-N-acetyl-D-galactosamine dehydrogenase